MKKLLRFEAAQIKVWHSHMEKLELGKWRARFIFGIFQSSRRSRAT